MKGGGAFMGLPGGLERSLSSNIPHALIELLGARIEAVLSAGKDIPVGVCIGVCSPPVLGMPSSALDRAACGSSLPRHAAVSFASHPPANTTRKPYFRRANFNSDLNAR